MFDSAYGPVRVTDVHEYTSDGTVRFTGVLTQSADAKADEYLADLSDIRLTPVVA